MNSTNKKIKPASTLEQITGLGSVSLEKLYLSNITTLPQLATLDLSILSEITGLTGSACKKILAHANSSYTFKMNTATSLIEKTIDRKYCTTNSKVLDSLLSGGLEEGSTYEFYGAFGSGKTQIVFSTIACFLTNPLFIDNKVLILDTENTFVATRLEEVLLNKKISKEEITLLLNRVLIFRPKTVEEQIIILSRLKQEGEINSTQGLIKMDEIKYIGVDSLVCLFRSTFLGRATLQERQQKINQHLSDLSSIVEDYNTFCIITNQVVSSPDPYTPDIIPVGGNIVAHASTHRIRLKRYAGGFRSARVMDSPSLPEVEVKFRVDQTGVRD